MASRTPFRVVFLADRPTGSFPSSYLVGEGGRHAGGMYEGRNAGAWTVGVHESGNDTYDQLREAEPDFLIPSIKDLPEVIFNQIDPRLARGELPGQGIR